MEVKNNHRSKFSNLSIELTLLPMCGFIARLVEQRIGIAEVTGSNPVEVLIFSGFFFPLAQIRKFTAVIILHFPLDLSLPNCSSWAGI